MDEGHPSFGSVRPMSALRSLLVGLVDDAALFPPGNAPMDVGLRAHARHHAASYGEMVGPFLCPVSRVDEMVAALPDDQQLELSLVVDVTGEATHAALRTVGTDPRVTLVAVEAAQVRLGDDAAAVGENMRRLPTAVGYLEVPRTGFDEALDLVALGGWRAAKYRTGGVGVAEVPDVLQLAGFLLGCVRRGLAFKLTAGLHHATAAGWASDGPRRHGVLNVLAAVAAAQAGDGQERLSALLATEKPVALADDVSRWSDDICREVRSSFRSFGCCGVTDPIDELAELGLVARATDEEPVA
jgi:hypothetical protein